MFARALRLLHMLEPWQRLLYSMFFALFIAATGFSTVNPFLPLYVESLSSELTLSTELLAGLVYSVPAFGMMIASPIWGVLADRYGRKLMVQRSLFGGTVVFLLMGLARSAEQVILLRGLQGMFTGTLAASTALVAASTPRTRSGYAMAMLQVGMLAGIALGPLIGGIVADTLGYGMAFTVASLLLAAAGALVLFSITEDRAKQDDNENVAVGFLPQMQQIIAIPGILVVYLMRFLSELARIIMLPVLPLFVVTLVSADAAVNTITGIMVGVASLSGTAAAIYLGRLGDRLGHKRIVTTCAVAAGLLYLAHSRVTTVWQMLVVQTLLGAASGGVIPMVSALLAQYVHSGHEGGAYGLDNSIRAAAGVGAPLLASAIAFWLDLRSVYVITGFVLLFMAVVASVKLPAMTRK